MTPFKTIRPFALLFVAAKLAFPLQTLMQAEKDVPDNGYVSSGIFTSKFFGFTYKIPQGLTPQSTQMQEHPIDPSHSATKHFNLLLAAKPTKPYKNVAIQAQSAAGFKDGADYLDKVASTARRVGLTVLDSPKKTTIAGETFFRQDHYSPKGSFYQTHVCTVSKGYILDFVLSANDRADIEQLLDSLSSLRFNTTGDAAQVKNHF